VSLPTQNLREYFAVFLQKVCKGSLRRDFRLQVAGISFPQTPEYTMGAIFTKTRGGITGIYKKFGTGSFAYFVEMLFGCCLH
jgi:hypothetical protein